MNQNSVVFSDDNDNQSASGPHAKNTLKGRVYIQDDHHNTGDQTNQGHRRPYLQVRRVRRVPTLFRRLFQRFSEFFKL